MPTYTYRSIETNEILDIEMTINQMLEFEKNYSESHERVYHTVNVVDPAGIGISKPPSDFSKHVLGKIKANNYKSEIGNGRWSIPREI